MGRVVLVLAAVCALARTARADAAQADAAVRDAEALVAAGDFVAAATKYREAYAADPRVELMCNVGVAYHKAKDLPRAQLYLSHCLKRGTALEASFVAAVRGVLATVETALKAGDFTPVDIVVDPEATSVEIADASFIGSHLVWLPFGTHTIRFRAEGYFDQSIDITASTRELTPVQTRLVKKPDPKPIVVDKNPVRIKHERRSLWPAIGTSAVTVVATVLAVVSFQRAHARADIAPFAVTEDVYARDRDYVDKWNKILAVSGAIAVLGAGASGFLWYRALTSETKVEVLPTPVGATVTFRARF